MSTDLMMHRTPAIAPADVPSIEGPSPMSVILGVVALVIGLAMTLAGPAVLMVLGLGIAVTVLGLAASWAAVMLML